MANTYVQGGLNTFIMNGIAYTCAAQLSVETSNVEVEWQENWSGEFPAVYKPKVVTVTAKLFYKPDYQITALRGQLNVSVLVLLANGHTLTYNSAVVQDVGEVDTKDNTFTIKIQAVDVQET